MQHSLSNALSENADASPIASVAQRRFLPEWHPQWGVLLAWPDAATDWTETLEEADVCYRQLIAAISHYANVLIIHRDTDHQQHIVEQIHDATDIVFDRLFWVCAPFDDTWARDFGPLTIEYTDAQNNEQSRQLRALDFIFNGWGNKFDAAQDNAINLQLAHLGVFGDKLMEQVDLVLEGGSVETDGQDTLLTTETCLLNPNRNPGLDKAGIEAALKQTLGIERVLWLKHGHLEGDDTDAHIDTLARFADPHTIVYMNCDDPDDSHYASLQAMQEELRALRQTNGEPYKLIPVPLPAAIYDDGRRLPASYVNFLITNGAVLLPVYGDERTDPIAIAQVKAAFPKHEIVPIDCNALIKQNGSLHCVTMQLY